MLSQQTVDAAMPPPEYIGSTKASTNMAMALATVMNRMQKRVDTTLNGLRTEIPALSNKLSTFRKLNLISEVPTQVPAPAMAEAITRASGPLPPLPSPPPPPPTVPQPPATYPNPTWSYVVQKANKQKKPTTHTNSYAIMATQPSPTE